MLKGFHTLWLFDLFKELLDPVQKPRLIKTRLVT